MIKINDLSFQRDTPVFVFRSFIAHGRRWNRGDDFPWQALGIPDHKVAILFRTGRLKHRTGETQPAPVSVEPAPQPVMPPPVGDDLDQIDDMKELRRIADDIGAPYKVSKADQRQAIREARG